MNCLNRTPDSNGFGNMFGIITNYMQHHPFVSIILITWNNKKYLQTCLDKLANQTIQNFEVIIVDNGSEDKTLDELHLKNFAGGTLIHRLSSNLGFTVANNIGVHLAHGKWLALLNADAFPQPDWLEKLVRLTEEKPGYASYTSRQIQENSIQLLDGAGDSYHVTGLAWRRYYNKPVQEYGKKLEEVFSACPAAALYSRKDFLQAGGFDEDFFSYFEDVDLGFRLRLAGKKCLYVPEAIVHHVGSASTGKRSDFSVYYGYRNMIWTFFKNMPSPLIWYFLPIHIATVMFFVVYLSMRGQGKIITKAVIDAIRGLPKVIKKRKIIQRNKKIKTSDLLKIMSTGLLEPYHEFIQRNRSS